MDINIGIIDLFQRVFGVNDAFDPKFAPVQGVSSARRTNYSLTGAPYYKNDLQTGKEYYLPVTVTYVNGNDETVVFDLPNCVVSVDSSKHVIETELTERRGKVSELINTDSYRISVKGFCINPGANELPENDVIALRELFECDAPIQISNVLTDVFLLRSDRKGTDLVTIRKMELPFTTGIKNVKAYTIEFMSEEPFNLIEIS